MPPSRWSSNNSAVAKVDSGGSVQTAALGFADITATIEGARGCSAAGASPPRIEVTPADVSVPFGSQQHFDAVAYDSRTTHRRRGVTWRVMVGGGITDSTTLRASTPPDVYPRPSAITWCARRSLYQRSQPVRARVRRLDLRAHRPDGVPHQAAGLHGGLVSFPAPARQTQDASPPTIPARWHFPASLDGMTGALLKWRGSGTQRAGHRRNSGYRRRPPCSTISTPPPSTAGATSWRNPPRSGRTTLVLAN